MEIAANIILGLLGITFVYGFYCVYRVSQTMKCMSRTIEAATQDMKKLREDQHQCQQLQ